MNVDRLLQIYQSVNLAIIRKYNAYMMGYQAEQCGQIIQLRKQIDVSNSMTRQILENQLREIQHQESLKYYKALVYNVREAVNIVADTEDMAFKFFLNHLFSDVFKLHLQEAKENLEEISDKVFCSEVEKVLKANTEQTLAMKDKYLGSTFHTLLDSEKSYNEQQDRLLEERKKLILLEKEKNRMASPKSYRRFLPAIVIWGICSLLFIWMNAFVLVLFASGAFIFFIYKDEEWKKNYTSYLDDFKRKQELLEVDGPFATAKKEYDDLETQLKVHPYVKAKYDLSLEYPRWEEILEKISSYLPTSEETEKIKTDPLLYEAAKWIVTKQCRVDSTTLQRQFSIGYTRSSDILKQLEDLEITYENMVLLPDVESLNKLWAYKNL